VGLFLFIYMSCIVTESDCRNDKRSRGQDNEGVQLNNAIKGGDKLPINLFIYFMYILCSDA
jgi:hypothetical protein